MSRNLIGLEAVAHTVCRISGYDCVGRDILRYHRTSSNDTPLANSDTLKNDCAVTDPDVILHDSFHEVRPA
jgi:hypothetical protein